jgi:hypothetical protein
MHSAQMHTSSSFATPRPLGEWRRGEAERAFSEPEPEKRGPEEGVCILGEGKWTGRSTRSRSPPLRLCLSLVRGVAAGHGSVAAWQTGAKSEPLPSPSPFTISPSPSSLLSLSHTMASSLSLSDAVHSFFVLLSTASYALPAWEGITRGSPFYTLLFLTQTALTFVLHCEETGLCMPLKHAVYARLQGVSEAFSVFLVGVMMLVVLEVRGEFLGRCVAGAWAILAWSSAYSASLTFNCTIAAALSCGVLLFDIISYKRKFTATYFKRLGAIAGMGALGWGLFVLLHAMWLWHGVWHVYAAGSTYLLLLAQRQKRLLATKTKEGGGGSHRGATAGSANLMTPVKRRGGGAGATATTADARAQDEEDSTTV